jgi:WD40 repeat protein/serine/threonine protein kinase
MTERELFEAALELPPADRPAFLDGHCAGDAALRQRLEALLAKHDQAGSFLEEPLVTGVHAPESVPRNAEAPAATAGQMLTGRYKLLELIGEGGMGTVWMAQQTEPVKRLVALKLIKAGMDSKQVIARFEAERQALALMDHTNIARVLDAGTTGAGRPYFVMDLVKGVPITKYCDERQLTPRQRLELFIPVCQAVQHAHQKGIIHRDLKPSNVLIAVYDGKPAPKVIDFGVAKAVGQPLTEHTLVTGFGNIVGTLEYMSPEQAEVNQFDIDTRSDIYSLGVLLYELLTGSTPFSRTEFEKAGMLEMLRVIREQEPSKPSTKLSTAEGLPTLAANRGTEPAKLTKLVRGELDWIVMKALEKDRSRRYETANGFAMDVQRYLADEAVQACPPSAGYRLRKFVRRNKGPVLAALILLVMLMAMLGLAVVSNYQINDAFTKLETEQENTAAALSRETEALTKRTEALDAKTKALEDLGQAQKETEAANTTLKDALEREQQAAYQHRIALAHHEWLGGNPDRSHQLLMECPEKYRHWEWNFLHRLHHTDLLTLRPGGYVDDVAYSPDGRLLASAGATPRVWDARTGRLLHTLTGHTKQVHRVVFSPDGSRLATSSLDDSLRVWDAATGRQLVTIDRPTGQPTQGLAFTPDSRQIASAEGGLRSSAVKFWDVATGNELFSWKAPSLPSNNSVIGAALSPDGKHMAVFSYSAIWLVEVETKKAVPLKMPASPIVRVVFSRDGGRLAACGSGQVRIWHVPSGNVQTTAHFAAVPIYGLAFSPDGRSLAVSNNDHTVQVHDAADGRAVMTLRGHSDVVNAAVFSPNGRQIASAGRDGTIRFWDITAPQEGPWFSGLPGQIRRTAFSGDGQRLTAIGPRLQTWEVITGRALFARQFAIMPGTSVSAPGTALSQDGRYLAGTTAFNLFLFEATTGKEVFAERNEKYQAHDLAFSPDGRLLAQSSWDGSVRVRDGQTGRLLQSLEGHRSGAAAPVRIAFSPDGTRLASTRWPDVKIWDTGTWQELFSLNGHRANVLSLSFSVDNHVWDATMGTKMFDLSGQADPVTCVTFSPDKKRLFSCGQEGSINVWDLQNRVKLLTLHHRGEFVAISPDGRRLASCDSNARPKVQVWESELLSREERWKRHQERIPFWQPQEAGKIERAPVRP